MAFEIIKLTYLLTYLLVVTSLSFSITASPFFEPCTNFAPAGIKPRYRTTPLRVMLTVNDGKDRARYDTLSFSIPVKQSTYFTTKQNKRYKDEHWQLR